MSIKTYKLTKSKITSGLQCKKKLWYDVHDPLKSSKSTFERGERFNEVVRKHYTKIYGKELNLTGVWDDLVNKTKRAINSKDIDAVLIASATPTHTKFITLAAKAAATKDIKEDNIEKN